MATPYRSPEPVRPVPAATGATGGIVGQLLRILVPPVALLLVLSGLLFWQVGHLLELTEHVDRSTEVIAKGNDLFRLFVQQEASLRGYLLTGDATLLDPYRTAHAQVGAELQTLEALVAQTPEQVARLERLHDEYAGWEVRAEQARRMRADDGQDPETLQDRYARMRRLRAQMTAFLDAEHAMHTAYTAAVHRQVRFDAGLGTAVVLLLVAGLSLTSRRGLLRVKATYDRAIADERSARRALEDLLAAVSHDLRSPLSVIVMNNALTLKNAPSGEPGDPVRRRAGVVQRAAERMDRLIQDLLSASRIEAGRLSLELRSHDVLGIVSDAEELFAPIAAQRSIHLSSEVPEGPCPLRCDRDRLLQVVSNLVDNALKFTPEGGTVTVTLRCLDDAVLLAVADTGPGIHTEQLPHIFEKHWSGRGKARADAGLGLYIVKGIVTAHGGTIQVDTKPGAGTTFSIALPRGTAQPGAPR